LIFTGTQKPLFRLLRRCALLTVVSLLAACTASWQAPMETRGAYPSSRAVVVTPRTVTQAARPPHRPIANSGYYRVQPGDTLYAIAWRTDRDFRELARWNRIAAPYTIYAGQQLRLTPPTTRASTAHRTGNASRHTQTAPPKPAPRTRPTPPASKPAPLPAKRNLHWAWPASGKVVSTYKARDPSRKGIKLAGRPGDPVRAAEAGKVVYSGSGLIGYGRLIIVKHNEKYLSAYGHNRRLLVRQGQQVTKGQKIAEFGRSNDGRPLLHFEIRRDGEPVNPQALLPRR
jgi:lipoprotein NlpD